MWAEWVVVVVLVVVEHVGGGCPALCECRWRGGKESALCARAALNAPPPGLPPTTQLLDLAGNRLTSLPDDAFASVGLLDLQRLYLVSCGLRVLKRYSFRRLVNLVELDLSSNRLEYVPSHTFSSITELRELKLSGNPLSKLKDDAFAKLTHLVRLDISSCKIVEIEPRAFAGVESSLEYLDLDKNLLRNLHVAAVAPLRSLKGLELFGNPWECTCALRPLRDWMMRKNVPATVTPECAFPPRLMSHSWDRLDLDDFACPPEVDTVSEHTSGYEGSEVTLVCKVSGMPSPRVRWLRSGRLISNHSSIPHVTAGRTFVLRGEGQYSKLIIKSADTHDAGGYTCTGENKAGKAEAHMTLVIDRSPPSKNFGDHMLLASVAVSAGVLMCASLAFLYVYEIRKRRRSVTWNEQIVNQTRRDENYEKVVSTCKDNVDSEVPLVNVDNGRKRGHYRNVPLHDSEEEDMFVRDTRPSVVDCEVRWQPTQMEPPPQRWNHVQEPDLHIPRRIELNIRRSPPSETTANLNSRGTSNITNAKCYNNNPRPPMPFKTRTGTRLDNDLSGSDSEKNYPDLIEMSSLVPTSSYTRPEVDQRPEPPSYFCTLPRKRNGDSRSPLLNSRRNSSGGDSNNSFEKQYEYRTHQKSRRSNSFLDLAGGGNKSFRASLPSSPNREAVNVPSATPLLDLSGLREYHVADYDYRASQLEKFLEEYQSLREHLKIIKETRENIQRSRAEHEDLKCILKVKPSVAVTEASSTALADAASPLALTTADYKTSLTTDWLSMAMYRN